MKSRSFEFAAISEKLSVTTETFHEIYSAKEMNEFLSKLDPDSFTPQALGEYFNRFNGPSESEAGEWMLAGLRALRYALSRVDESHALVLLVG